MPGLQLRLFQFDRLLEDMLPLLHRHLTRQGIKASMYASQWFMTLFSYRFPLDFVYRVLDSVFAEGLEAVFRFALSLMKKSEDCLVDLNFEQALAYLKGSDIVDMYKVADADAATEKLYDVDAFARDAFTVQVTPYMLDGYATEFEESVRVANAHRREVEALRLVNRNLAARVASLEEQLQQISAEHVDLVKQAVMSKVAKEEMEEDLVSRNRHVDVRLITAIRAKDAPCYPSPDRRFGTKCCSLKPVCEPIKLARVEGRHHIQACLHLKCPKPSSQQTPKAIPLVALTKASAEPTFPIVTSCSISARKTCHDFQGSNVMNTQGSLLGNIARHHIMGLVPQ